MNLHARSRSFGFTLVELLVALTILSLVIGLIFGSLRLGVKMADSVESQVARSQRVHLVQRMLRRQLQQALPLEKAGAGESGRIDFEAGRERIEFVAPMTAGTSYSGLYRMSIKVEDDFDRSHGHRKLILSYELLIPDDDARFAEQEPQEVTILDDFLDAEFAYLDNSGRGADHWQDNWTDQSSLPGLIRLRIRHADTEGFIWPDFIVALKATSLTSQTDS